MRTVFSVFLLFSLCQTSWAATFGTVVPVRGTVSDIALDERRGKLYIANFSANRVEVMSTSDRSLGTPMGVSMPPSSVAMSPDNRFLVVGHDNNFGSGNNGGFTVFDLDANQKREVVIPDAVLAVAFGAGSRCLLVTKTGLLLLEPLAATTHSVAVAVGFDTTKLPVPFASFPPSIISAAAGVSGDKQYIMVLALSTKGANVVRYHVGDISATSVGFVSSPTLGPVVISPDEHAQNYAAGWVLSNLNSILLAQFPYASGQLNIGTHAWDYSRNRIFAQIPVTGDTNVLHVVDTDNLTVRERIQLPQNLAGHSIFSSDQNTLYSVSISGVTVFPIGTFDRAPRVASVQEDVMFLGDGCNRSFISQNIDIVDLGGGNIDFTLSVPDGTKGIKLSQTSGTTPARVRIDVDPTAYQNAKGTTAVPLNISSTRAINLAFPARLLINTHDVNQRGRIVNVPGKITDILADPRRNRTYLIRQDKNLVLVYDSTMRQITAPAMRTGNTPVGMAITTDGRYLITGNDNSQIASVFDLDTLQPSAPIVFPFGHYPRSVAVSNASMLQIARNVSVAPPNPDPAATPVPNAPGVVDRIDFDHRIADTLPTLGIYQNSVSVDSALGQSPGNNCILLSQPDGNVALYDATVDRFVSSRKDFAGLGGAYAALSDSLFLVDNHLFDPALVPIGDLENTSGSSSGALAMGSGALRTTAATASGPGTLQRIDFANLQTFHGALTIEAPGVLSSLKTPTVGLIGQTILPFVRTLAVAADQSSILELTTSGMAVVAPNFDAPTTVPSVAAVVNSADHTSAVAPGGLIQINGIGLAPGAASATGLPLPSTLGDICATVNNIALPLFSVSGSQISAQLPFTVRGDSLLVVKTPGGISSSFIIHVQDFAPAVFRSGQAGDQTGIPTIIRSANNEFVTFTNPIHPDEMLSIYLTGLSVTSPAAPLGDGAPFDPLAVASTQPTVTLGGMQLPIAYAGLAPGEVGVYQIVVSIPRGIRDAGQSSLVITQGTFSTTLPMRVVSP